MHHSKLQVQTYWDERPCGSTEVSRTLTSPEFFQAHACERYRREPMIEPFAAFDRWARRKILEIGVGMGADFVRFRKSEAEVIGIDLSPHSLELARHRAEIEGVIPTLINADAETLPFPDGSFNMVYSWGVLMCAPDVGRTVREIYRVLKPGGECRVMLYNRHSLLAFQIYLYYGLLRGRPFARLWDLIQKHLESPGTKAFTCAEARDLFREFAEVEIKPTVTVYDLRFGRRWFAPRWMIQLVPGRLGWFLLIRAQK